MHVNLNLSLYVTCSPTCKRDCLASQYSHSTIAHHVTNLLRTRTTTAEHARGVVVTHTHSYAYPTRAPRGIALVGLQGQRKVQSQ